MLEDAEVFFHVLEAPDRGRERVTLLRDPAHRRFSLSLSLEARLGRVSLSRELERKTSSGALSKWFRERSPARDLSEIRPGALSHSLSL